MGMKEIEAGKVLYETGDVIDKIYLIIKGQVKATFPGGSYTLKSQDVVGVVEFGQSACELRYEALEKCQMVEYAYDGKLLAFLQKNGDIKKFLLFSVMKQFNEVFGFVKLQKNDYESLRNYISTVYDDYRWMCETIGVSAGELTDFDEIYSQESEDSVPDWMSGYYTNFSEIIMGSDPAHMESDFAAGVVIKTGEDVVKMVSSLETFKENRTRLLNLLMNENSMDLFELMLSLYLKAAKKVGMDSPDIRPIFMGLTDVLGQAESQGFDKEDFFAARKRAYDDALKTAEMFSKVREEQQDTHGQEQMDVIRDSLETILGYAEMGDEFNQSFRAHVDKYKKTVNKNSTDDEDRKLRLQISKEFNALYIAAFIKSAEDIIVPTVVKMFFNFGYVDEELCGIDNAVYLCQLVDRIPSDPDHGIYSYYEWLQSIYDGRKDPGRNEFEMDFADFLHEEVRNHRISKADETEMFNDPVLRVKYELENVFSVVNKTSTGRILTFCPLFSEHNVVKSVESMLVNAEDIAEGINKIRRIDKSAFYRETMFADQENLVSNEIIDVEILPDIILAPNIGNRGIMWQEIEGKRRTTPARMFISMFQQEELFGQLLKLTGQFRWEMCKRVQGARWNDITEPSLTSEYFDYIQYYRKNNDLSAEAKEKVKNDLLRSKNSFREMFIRDYAIWIQFESQGSPRLNKVSRAILFAYVPFAASIRENLAINPMYKEMITRYDTKQKAKIHRMDNLMKKITNGGKVIPKEIEEQMQYLQG